MLRSLLHGAAALTLGAGICLAQTVSVGISSAQDGQTVAPGATIDWSISFTVSGGDNAGLALLSADVVQDGANPESMNIPPAGGVPGAMTNFSRPDGISNPGEGGAATGYIGVQRGAGGAMNLVQVGGGQNGFGQAFAPGTGIAENANVVAGVGQSGAVTLASGSFTAPATEGDYTFSLANVLANVFTQINTPPAFSPAAAATINITDASFTFTVGDANPCPGDIDGMNGTDLNDLLILLGTFGDPGGAADLDGMNGVDLNDLLILLGDFGCTP